MPAPPSWWQRTLSYSVMHGFLRYRLFPRASPKFASTASADARITNERREPFRSDFRELIKQVRESGADTIISTQWMASHPSCQDLNEFVGSSPEQVQNNRELGQWIAGEVRLMAAKENRPLIDGAAELTCDRQLLGDAMHLTREGHRQMAGVWAEALVPLLRAREHDLRRDESEAGS